MNLNLNLTPLLTLLHSFAIGEVIRLALTAFVVVFVPMALKLSRMRLHSVENSTMSQRLERQIIWRNAIILTGVVIILAVWSTKLANFALSLAAVAAALLVVNKEAVMNLMGFVNLTISRPFTFGDYVEIGGASGRVVDINAMMTTVLETKAGHQVTGATVSVPNALLLIQPVRNLTVTGRYVVHLLCVRIGRNEDILRHEQALLASAQATCGEWQAEADAHLTYLERQRHVDLPSAEVKVIIEMHDARHVDLSVRYACRPNERVKVEQDILRRYIGLSACANAGLKAGAAPAGESEEHEPTGT